MGTTKNPLLTYPIDSEIIDSTDTLTVTWAFRDDDAGDAQTEYQIHYWMPDDWGGTYTIQSAQVSSNEYHEFAANTFSTDGLWVWNCRTKDTDPGAFLGYFSAPLGSFYAYAPPAAPAIQLPADSGSISTVTYEMTWTHADQDAYQCRRVANDGGSPDTDTIYEDSGEVTASATRGYTFTMTVTGRDEHWQVRVKKNGLWSDTWDSHQVTIAWVAPDTPTLTATAGGAGGSGDYITVDPTPGDESDPPPVVATFDILRTVDSEDADDAIRIATGIDDDATYVDYDVVPGKTYRYIARAVAVSTGTVKDSALTA